MERYNEELRAHLMETNNEFRQLALQHSQYAQQLDALEALPHLSEQDQIEEHRLKKLKLRLKDQMLEMMNRHRAEHVA
jgi:uncharacterized protein YdcH (DUF465 family)